MVDRNKNQTNRRGFLGIQLSRKGWNNVLIYLVLAVLIIVWRTSSDDTQDSVDEVMIEESSQVVDEPATESTDAGVTLFPAIEIVELQLPSWHLQQSTEGWLVEGTGSSIAEDAAVTAETLVGRWQNIEVEASSERMRNEAVEVAVRLADGRPQILLALYQQGNNAYLEVAGDEQLYLVTNASYAELLASPQNSIN